MATPAAPAFVILETRVSPHGNVWVKVALTDGRRFTVQVPAHRNTPEFIAEAVAHYVAVGRGFGPK